MTGAAGFDPEEAPFCSMCGTYFDDGDMVTLSITPDHDQTRYEMFHADPRECDVEPEDS